MKYPCCSCKRTNQNVHGPVWRGVSKRSHVSHSVNLSAMGATRRNSGFLQEASWQLEAISCLLNLHILHNILATPSAMRKISSHIRDNILSLLLQGLSSREIARRVRAGRTTVNKCRRQTSHDIPMPRGGRPRRIMLQEMQRVVRAIETGRCRNAS